jgi:hypothetical protein
MSEIALRHQVVSLDYTVNIGAMNADCDTHYHVLWAFSNTAINAEKVGTFEGLESETTCIVI